MLSMVEIGFSTVLVKIIISVGLDDLWITSENSKRFILAQRCKKLLYIICMFINNEIVLKIV